ncbi:hypothetical protein [Kribbella antibiotica]|uniref:hypothetical protein n=1 Tax=Kribbella antibiotica TaxID=190195 RepID=UPI0014043444|nr:hypothetical protein [Kribbella antibiotica]
MPSAVVTTHDSLSLSPLPVGLTTLSILDPSSFLSRQPLAPLTSSPPWPLSARVAFSYFQQKSYLPAWPSSLHDTYLRSM